MSAVAEQPAAEAEAALLSYLGSVLGEDALRTRRGQPCARH